MRQKIIISSLILALFLLVFSASFIFHQNYQFRNVPLSQSEQTVLSGKTSLNSIKTPQRSFGELINPSLSASSDYKQEALAKYEKLKEFLKIIEENGKKSLSDLKSWQAVQNPITENISETSKEPFLASNVAGYFLTPIPTLHPQLEDILSQANSSSNQSIYAPANIGQANSNLPKYTYTIALLGDSMTETLGKDIAHLRLLLKESYPNYDFVLLNYGQGSTDIESGLYRLTNQTNYLDENFPPLVAYKPDLIVVESFAYNHWGTELKDLDRQWLTIARIIKTIREYTPNTAIIMATTISPNPYIYGDGLLNWPEHQKWDATITTKAYLQNMINFATSQGFPLADAYTPSLNSDGHGDPKYINPIDHLHLSEEGKVLYAQKIVETIKNNYLIPFY